MAARAPAVDTACVEAVALARAAAVEEAGSSAAVGEHLGAEAEGERLVVHRFASLLPGYRGWQWTVVVTRASRAKTVTVDDVVLLAGPQALIAPQWVPWSQRLRPGDLGVGDLLPTAADDPRLVLRRSDVDGWSDTDLYVELGLGRPRVLSAEGRDDAATRWTQGEGGPDTSMARSAPGRCLGCGFFLRLVGALGRTLGVCANEMAPADGRVVTVDHGCGAHSEALIAPATNPEPHIASAQGPAGSFTFAPGAIPEHLGSSDLPPADDLVPLGHAAGSVADSEPAEPYGHS